MLKTSFSPFIRVHQWLELVLISVNRVLVSLVAALPRWVLATNGIPR
jgi:hypothetical protein